MDYNAFFLLLSWNFHDLLGRIVELFPTAFSTVWFYDYYFSRIDCHRSWICPVIYNTVGREIWIHTFVNRSKLKGTLQTRLEFEPDSSILICVPITVILPTHHNNSFKEYSMICDLTKTKVKVAFKRVHLNYLTTALDISNHKKTTIIPWLLISSVLFQIY